MRKKFITYPKTEISIDDPMLEIIDPPLKDKARIFITGYVEDYGEPPSIDLVCQALSVPKVYARDAIFLFGKLRD